MSDISKLPGVIHSWPTKQVHQVQDKNMEKKDKKNKKGSENKDENDGKDKHIDEYA